MKRNQLKKGNIILNSAGAGTVAPEMTHKRAGELSRIKGRSAKNVLEADESEARGELIGDQDENLKEKFLETVPESQRWNPIGGSAGHKVEPVLEADGDEEGRSDNELLVEQGVNTAENEQMRKGNNIK